MKLNFDKTVGWVSFLFTELALASGFFFWFTADKIFILLVVVFLVFEGSFDFARLSRRIKKVSG